MHPHVLHALAAAHSLSAARTLLALHVAREARHNHRGLLDAAHTLRSSSAYGIRHGIGGHGDPTTGVLLAPPQRETTWTEREAQSDKRLTWLADQLAPGAGAPLARLITRLPDLQPGTAAALHRHLDDEDQLVRGWVDMPPRREPLPGIACPHCGERQLAVQTAGPVDVWTVVCTTWRRCTGPGCPCGMPGAVEGVAHIWPRSVVLGAVAGAAPTSSAN